MQHWEEQRYLYSGKIQHGGLPEDGILPRFAPLAQQARIAFSNRIDYQGKLCAFGFSDGTTQIWDCITHKLLYEIDAHVAPVTHLSWSANGAVVCTVCPMELCVRGWQVSDGSLAFELFTDTNLLSAEFHPLASNVLTVLPFGLQPYIVSVHEGIVKLQPDVLRMQLAARSTEARSDTEIDHTEQPEDDISDVESTDSDDSNASSQSEQQRDSQQHEQNSQHDKHEKQNDLNEMQENHSHNENHTQSSEVQEVQHEESSQPQGPIQSEEEDKAPHEGANKTFNTHREEVITSIKWGLSFIADDATLQSCLVASTSLGRLYVTWIGLDLHSPPNVNEEIKIRGFLPYDRNELAPADIVFQVVVGSIDVFQLPEHAILQATLQLTQQSKVSKTQLSFPVFALGSDRAFYVLRLTFDSLRNFFVSPSKSSRVKDPLAGMSVDACVTKFGIKTTSLTDAKLMALHSATSTSSATGGYRSASLCCDGTGSYFGAAIRLKSDHAILIWSVDLCDTSNVEDGGPIVQLVSLLIGDKISVDECKLGSVAMDCNLDDAALDNLLALSRRNDGVGSLSWHPRRCIMYAAGGSGLIRCWTKIQQEDWSAFAPYFTELKRNIHHVESETEFDNVPSKLKGNLEPDMSACLVPGDSLQNKSSTDEIIEPVDDSNEHHIVSHTPIDILTPSNLVDSLPGKQHSIIHRRCANSILPSFGQKQNTDGHKTTETETFLSAMNWAVAAEGLRAIVDTGRHAGVQPALKYHHTQNTSSQINDHTTRQNLSGTCRQNSFSKSSIKRSRVA